MTIKAKLERAREIIDEYELLEKFSQDHVHEIGFLTGTEIQNICRVRNPKTGKDDRYLVVKFKGEEENHFGFSWAKRIRGKHGDKEYRAKEVFRNTVWHHLAQFKDASEQECFLCGSTKDDMHVDHLWPPFQMIVSEWIELNGLPEIERSKSNCGHVFRFHDDEIGWQLHHYNSSAFLMLCSKCNTRKSNKHAVIMCALWNLSFISRQDNEFIDKILNDVDDFGFIKPLIMIGRLTSPVGPIYKRYT